MRVVTLFARADAPDLTIRAGSGFVEGSVTIAVPSPGGPFTRGANDLMASCDALGFIGDCREVVFFLYEESLTSLRMRTCWFIVIESQGRWWVDCEGKAYGPMDSRDEAIRHAKKIAEAFVDPDRQPQVWTSSPSERPSLIWSGSVRRAA